ncbi:MAG: hypothetical protein FJ403_01085 [Verrucomicrobia bacterium]|nr:hypothetical protein [Verrucomicrobiota bacterium]
MNRMVAMSFFSWASDLEQMRVGVSTGSTGYDSVLQLITASEIGKLSRLRRIPTILEQAYRAGPRALQLLPPLSISIVAAVQLASLLTLLAAPPVFQTIEIEDGGSRPIFEIVEETSDKFGAINTKNGQLQGVIAPGLKVSNGATKPVLYEVGKPRSASTRRLLTPKVLVHAAPDANWALARSSSELKSIKALAYAPGYFICEATDAAGTLRLASDLRRAPAVLAAEPILGKRQWKKSLPSDPLLANQWYLLNSPDTAKVGINITNVWTRFRGRGITVAVVDDGLNLTHPDLTSNVLTNSDYDFRDNDDDSSPGGNEDYHGTAVAGIIAARGNNSIGVAGVAYEASLLGVRLIGGDEQTDDQNAAAVLHQHPIVHVNNSSWGPQDDGQTLEAPGKLLNLALEKAVRDGRGGKGTVFVWPAGNGRARQDDANYDGYANSIYTIAVGSIDHNGKQGAYSEPGACVIVSAPSHGEIVADENRIVTTDLAGELGLNKSSIPGDLPDVDYTQTFGGSSAATALVSGVAALIVEANPALGWRDVQEILIRSAAKTDPTESDWMTNSVGLCFNHKYGAGLLNADAAVRMATEWTNLGPQTNLFLIQTNLLESIPDNAPAGVTKTLDFSKARSLRVEHVTVTVSIAHSRRGDLAITLVSPHGTRSRLAERHLDSNPDYNNWKFMSVFNWGEPSQGQWQVHVSDLRSNHTGTLDSIRVHLYGMDAPLLAKPALTAAGLENGRLRMLLSGVPGTRYEVQSSSDLAAWTNTGQSAVLPASGEETIEIMLGGGNARFFRVRNASPP